MSFLTSTVAYNTLLITTSIFSPSELEFDVPWEPTTDFNANLYKFTVSNFLMDFQVASAFTDSGNKGRISCYLLDSNLSTVNNMSYENLGTSVSVNNVRSSTVIEASRPILGVYKPGEGASHPVSVITTLTNGDNVIKFRVRTPTGAPLLISNAATYSLGIYFVITVETI